MHAKLQKQIKNARGPLALEYSKNHSNTTRSKIYKKGCHKLHCQHLDKVLAVDIERKRVVVQPRVNMEKLVRSSLRHGLIPLVVPEFKGITVGGAIMGAAAESTSHHSGIFHDSCARVALIDGTGHIVHASRTENAPLFYGISGSYGSLGFLIEAEIDLMEAKPSVLLRYYPFQDPHEGLHKMESLMGNTCFLDGILFSDHHGVIMAGEMISGHSSKPYSNWFAAHAQTITQYKEEKIPLFEYLFRYDQGAFWMGSLLFSLPFLKRYVLEGLLKQGSSQPFFSQRELSLFKQVSYPGPFARFITQPFMNSQSLWGLLHRAEHWIQDRLIIQDCCIPTSKAHLFLNEILQQPALYPIWLCPLKGTQTPQIFAPHYGNPSYINFGIYGLPATASPMENLIRCLEKLTQSHVGRKVLYSRSYYSEEEFWKIYPRQEYESLRSHMKAEGIWRGLTEKVLSI